MTPIDTKHLRTVANAATPKSWSRIVGKKGDGTAASQHEQVISDDCVGVVMIEHDGSVEGNQNAHHIATFDPPTIIALLDRLEELDRKVEMLETPKKAAP